MSRTRFAGTPEKLLAALLTSTLISGAPLLAGVSSPSGSAGESSRQDAPPSEDHHGAMNHRGAHVMGFDQEKTTHHFYLYEDGGAIDVSVNDVSDVKDRDAIRAHLPHIATMFGQGNFQAPMMVHDRKDVPGAATMAALKDKITYKYADTPKGGRVDVSSKDKTALQAVHEFLRFQISDHRTADPVTVGKRE